jgi:serine protease Do
LSDRGPSRLFRAAALVLCCFIAASVRAESAPPSIVRIIGHAAGSGGEPGAPVRHALGYIVEADGFLLTNYRNLVDPATGRLLPHYRVTTAADPARTFPAEIIGVEPAIDVGVLKVEGAPPFAASADARALPITTGMKLRAAANFAGGEVSFADGEVTGLNTRQCYQESLTSTMFRARIALGPEAIGGPVFLAETGAVVALCTGYHPPTASGHVEDPQECHLLPISLCFNIYDSLKQRRSRRSPWTGFSVRPLTSAEQRFFPTEKRHQSGVGIEFVWPGSPAERLGIRVDDVLVQFGYNRVTSVADFQKWLYLNGVGQTVKLIFLRGGREYLTADYAIEERPASARPR